MYKKWSTKWSQIPNLHVLHVKLITQLTEEGE